MNKHDSAPGGETISKVLENLIHILNGGGRKYDEHVWYHLRKVKCEPSGEKQES
jgi:hypothetical protein